MRVFEIVSNGSLRFVVTNSVPADLDLQGRFSFLPSKKVRMIFGYVSSSTEACTEVFSV